MKNKFLFSIIIMLSSIPLNIKATNDSVNISCDKIRLAPNETTTCKISGTSSTEVSALSMKLSASKLNISDVVVDSSWQGDGLNGKIDLYTDSNKKNTFNIVTFKIKAPSNSEITDTIDIKDITFANSIFEERSLNNVSLDIQVVSSDSTLDNIKVKYEEEMKELNMDDLKLSVPSNINNIELIATASSLKSTITGIGLKKLKYGSNNFNIKVTSESGSSTEYVVTIIRSEIRELSSLKVNDKIIELKENVYEYDLNVDSGVSNVKIDATLKNPEKANIVSDLSNINLKAGINIIEIVISDENDEKLIYKLNIEKESSNSNASDEKLPTDDKKDENNKVNNPKTGIGILIKYIILFIIFSISVVAFNILKNKKYLK